MPDQPDVLADVEIFLARYLQCSQHQRAILALWILHTYCFTTAQVTPYLSIRSAQKHSGKTLCLQLLSLLCDHPVLSSGGIKAADLALPMSQKRISALLFDECQITLGTRSRSKSPALRALLAGSFHLLLGFNNVREERNAFYPKAFVADDLLPQELADRSIPIILEPLPTAAQVSSYSLSPVPCSLPDRFHLRRAADQVQPIRDRLNHWAHLHLLPVLDKMLPLPRSAFPPHLTPRQQDMCEPLLQLAGLVGGPWPERAVRAFAIIFESQTAFELRPHIQLLADIRDCFAHHGFPDRLSTAVLLDHLLALDRPWNQDGRFSAHTLARMLKPFAICPSNHRKGKAAADSSSAPSRSSKFARGYRLQDFHQPWKQYLEVAVSGSQSAPQDSEIINKNAPCDGVALEDASPLPTPHPEYEIQNIQHQKSYISSCSFPATCPLSPAISQESTEELQARKKALLLELYPQLANSPHLQPGAPDVPVAQIVNEYVLGDGVADFDPAAEIVPAGAAASNQKSHIENQKSAKDFDPVAEIVNNHALGDGVADFDATAGIVPAGAQASNQKSHIENQKSAQKLHGADGEAYAEDWAQQQARLQGIYSTLKLQGTVDIPSLARSYSLEELKVKLDWVDAHDDWFFAMRHRPAQDFVAAFRSIILSSASPRRLWS